MKSKENLKIGHKLFAKVPIMKYNYQSTPKTSTLFCGDGRYVRVTDITPALIKISYRGDWMYLDKDIIEFAFFTVTEVRKMKLNAIENV